MAQDRKKQVSGEIPFHFYAGNGTQSAGNGAILRSAVSGAAGADRCCMYLDEPEERRETALKSLQTAAKATANGSDRFSRSNGCTLRCSRFAVFAKIRCLDIFYF